MASSVSLPLVVWHNFSNPTTTCLACSYPQVYAGQKDGHIWVYRVHEGTLQHKMLLLGHKAPVAALCIFKDDKNADASEEVLISASEDGEIARWSTSDGRCLAVNPNGFLGTPKSLKVSTQFSVSYLFCSGDTKDVFILDVTSLEVLRVWGGHGNFVTFTDFYDPVLKKSRLATLTVDGYLHVWDFDASQQVVYKDKSVDIPCLIRKQADDSLDTVLDLTSSASLPGLCMAVTNHNVMVFALKNGSFVPQITLPASPNASWTGGEFSGSDRLYLWTNNGNLEEYLLIPPQGVKPGSMASDESQLYYSAKLLHRHYIDNNGDTVSGTWITAVNKKRPERPDTLAAVAFSSDPADSMFTLYYALDSVDDTTCVKCSANSLYDVWPLDTCQKSKFGAITCTVPVSSNHLAVGYENGTICVTPLWISLLHLPRLPDFVETRTDMRIFEHAHNGRVTCMIMHESHQHQYLLSGGRDGAVKIWNLVDGKYVVSFTVHTLPVKCFIEPAEQTDTHIRGCVVSVAEDSSIAVISVDAMNCLFMIPGYSSRLSTIQWRTIEDYIVLGYEDETAMVWQMATGYLDRTLSGSYAKKVLDDDRWPVNRLTKSVLSAKPTGGTKQAVNLRPLVSESDDLQWPMHFGLLFSFNIRYLMHDLYAKFESVRKLDNLMDIVPTPQPSVSSTSYDAAIPEMMSFKPEQNDPLDVNEDEDGKAKLASEFQKRMELVSAIIAGTISWNVSQAFEDVCNSVLTLQRNVSYVNISYGLKGTNGNMAILAPLRDEKDAWKISQGMTASRLLPLALLAKVVIFIAGKETKSADLIAGYAMALPAAVKQGYCFPSLSILSKYWQDPSARSLFSSAVTGLSEPDILSLISYWEKYLPTSASPASHGPAMMARATIVLGIMGCDQPQMLSPSARKHTALSLALLLSDSVLDEPKASDVSGSSVARTLASMELLSQGFSTWESYINAAEILRTMFAYASGVQPAISRGARNALFKIARTNMPLVIGTLTFDATHAKKIEERLRCLRLIGMFIRKEPILLYSSVHRVVEAVVKTLDPNVPHLREMVLQTATSVLHDLVKTYPFVDFSSSSQKLSVGTLEGASVIYDLRTATRSVVLEGHTGPVVALAFSPDAKYVATSSLQDRTVRVWYSSLSLLGVLTSSLSHGLRHESSGDREGSTPGSQKAHKVFSFALPNIPDGTTEPYQVFHQVHFEWPSPRCVRLHIRDLVMSFNI